MTRIEMPKANPENLLRIVKDAHNGKVVLPEFQRSFVWSREDIEELLVSILHSYFIGTFLILDTFRKNPIFPFRDIEGLKEVKQREASDNNNHYTIRLVLDGQQRLTSLFYVLYEPEIPLRNSRKPYKFFLDIDLIQKNNLDDAVQGISLGDHRRLSDMQRKVNEGKSIPFSLFLDSTKFYEWLLSEEHTGIRRDDKEIVKPYYQCFDSFMVPVISISSEADEENIINIFERINRTGVSLSLFDLAAGRLYKKGIRLRDLWKSFANDNKKLVQNVKPEFILKMISIWEEKEPRNSTLLKLIDNLDKNKFESYWTQACDWITKAYGRVTSLEGYGAFDARWIPNTTLLIPLAILLHEIERIWREARTNKEEMYRKVDRWYWGSVFAQRYDKAVDATMYRDVREIKKWLELGDDSCPAWLSNFQASQIDLSEEGQLSSIYRGAMCLIAKSGAKDFISGQGATLEERQDDHIFPKAVYQKEPLIDSILNRTLISSASNKTKSSKHPSECLSLFLRNHGEKEEELRKTLDSHLISKKAQDAMKENNFAVFIEERRQTFQLEIDRKVKGDQ